MHRNREKSKRKRENLKENGIKMNNANLCISRVYVYSLQVTERWYWCMYVYFERILSYVKFAFTNPILDFLLKLMAERHKKIAFNRYSRVSKSVFLRTSIYDELLWQPLTYSALIWSLSLFCTLILLVLCSIKKPYPSPLSSLYTIFLATWRLLADVIINSARSFYIHQ